MEKVEANNNRQAISVTLPPVAIEWLDHKVEARVFASRSHAVEVLILEASMKDTAKPGPGATFQVNHQFQVSNVNPGDPAQLATLKDQFLKALDQAALTRMSPHVVATMIKGKRRLFYTLRKTGETVKSDGTVQTFIAVSQDLQPTRLTLTMTRDQMGFPGRLEGEETPLSEKEFEESGLNRQQVFAQIDRFTRGLDLY